MFESAVVLTRRFFIYGIMRKSGTKYCLFALFIYTLP